MEKNETKAATSARRTVGRPKGSKNVAKVRSKFEHITYEMAQKYLTHNTDNRGVSTMTVNRYATDLANGKWMPNFDSNIVFDKKGVLLNGQHRLLAIVNSGVPMDAFVVRGVDQDTFKTMDAGHNRTPGDTLYVYGVKDACKVAGIVSKYIALRDGVKGAITKEGGTRRNATKIGNRNYYILSTYQKFPSVFSRACAIFKILDKARRQLRLRTGLTGGDIGGLVAYLYLEKNHQLEQVNEFWNEFFEFEANKKYRHKYIKDVREILINSVSSNTRLTAQSKQTYLAKAWNLFIKDDVRTKKINVTSMELQNGIAFE